MFKPISSDTFGMAARTPGIDFRSPLPGRHVRACFRLSLLALCPLLVGCHEGSNASPDAAALSSNTAVNSGSTQVSTVLPVSGTAPAGGNPVTADPIAASPAAVPATKGVKRPEFNSETAFGLLTQQCEFGPRPLGSQAHDKTRDYLLAQMKSCADVTIAQTFQYRGMPVTNVIGVFYPEGETKPARNPVLLLTHWDSRPIADGPYSSEAQKSPAFSYGVTGWNRTTPIMAANDGASGTAVLLQLAHMFKQQKPAAGVVILLDDGEDYGDFHANGGAGEGVELGSRYFAKHFREDSRFGFPAFGILLDMIGGKDLVIPVERYSIQYAPGTLAKVFQAGQLLGYKTVFRSDLEFSVEDDHIALNRARIPVIDLIPFFGDSAPVGITGYKYWHTLQDTADKCSPGSLKVIGETVAEVVYSEAAQH